MKKVSKGMLKVIKRMTEVEVERSIGQWSQGRPPFCAGLFHQPKRPKAEK